ncbi:hypothetical protein Tco_0680622 [Tanacetum coccineum]|uniref:Uncharacterized protein n=1 Tax=Tanacetum coccineum TaxID=301880 RepID=A0ABQ4XL37_9ASTR
MESSFSNTDERDLQQLQERMIKMRKVCSLYFEIIKKHLKYLQTIRWNGEGAEEGFRRTFRRYFGDNRDTFSKKLSFNIDNLQRQIKKEYLHEGESRKCFTVLKTQFETFFTSKQVDSLNRKDQDEDRILKESFQKYTGKDLQTYRRELITYMDGLEMNIGRRALHENAERARVDKVVSDVKNDVVRPSFDNDTLPEVHHSNNASFENVFALEIQNHGQHEVDNCTKANREAQQANDYLTKALENFKEKLFLKQTTNESEYYKKIKFLNEEISNLKSQACQKEKSFHKENEKYAQYTAQTFHMLLPKEDNVNTGKQGIGFEIQNDVENPFILNKAKELTPSLYHIDKMGKDLRSDHKIISEEELKCEAEKCLKVKQRKSPLSYHGFVYGDTQFVEPPKVHLKRREVNLKKHLEQAQLVNYDPKLWNSLPMKYFCFVKHSMLKFEKQIILRQELNLRESINTWNHEGAVLRQVQERLSKEFEPLARNINL